MPNMPRKWANKAHLTYHREKVKSAKRNTGGEQKAPKNAQRAEKNIKQNLVLANTRDYTAETKKEEEGMASGRKPNLEE